jgi:hypothetical protein
MRAPFLAVLALPFLVFPVAACGGSTKDSGPGVPADGGTETSVSGMDSGTVRDATPDTGPDAQEASIPTTPGVLLFAGYGEAPLQDTWLWDGTTWTQLEVMGPSVRSDQAMIGTLPGFDKMLAHDALLFGGQGLGPYLGDTWMWTTSGWTQQQGTGPSAREGAAMAVLGQKVFLYGGSGATGGFLSDMWAWQGGKWTQVTLTGPTPGGRYGHSMVTLGNEIVLFGNVAGPTDTWTFDGTSWKQAATVGPTGQPGGLTDSRGFQTMAALGGKVYLFGGEQDANHILNDTWAWDGTAWTQVTVASPPPARFHAGMTTFQGKIVMFGGASAVPSGPGFYGDTWTFDGTTWTQVATTGPSPRYGYVLASR